MALFGKPTKPKVSMTSAEYRQKTYEAMSEAQHQEQLIYWMQKRGIYFECSLNGIFLPNTNKRGSPAFQRQAKANAMTMNKMKSQGMNNGVADLKIYLKDIELNIELKAFKGKASPDQLRVQKVINCTSYARYDIIKGYLDAIKLIEEHI